MEDDTEWILRNRLWLYERNFRCNDKVHQRTVVISIRKMSTEQNLSGRGPIPYTSKEIRRVIETENSLPCPQDPAIRPF